MRAVAACLIGVGAARGFIVRVHRVIVVALSSPRIAMASVTRGILMMRERHALRGRHRGHALDGQDESDGDCYKANESQRHCRRIVSHGL